MSNNLSYYYYNNINNLEFNVLVNLDICVIIFYEVISVIVVLPNSLVSNSSNYYLNFSLNKSHNELTLANSYL